jgi:hypothetical protein
MKNYIISKFLVLILVSISFGCKDNGNYQSVPTKKKIENDSKTHKVIAKAIEKAGMYNYVKVEENNKEFWIAIPERDITLGDTYFYKGGMKMVDFESKELDKVFEEVWFIDALFDKEPKVYRPVISDKNTVTSTMDIIEQPKNGTSIESLLKNSEALLNKTVLIKGKVVKVNRNILNRNWVHIQDGTSFDTKSEVTITTLDTLNKGDIVTFRGLVTLNKDFGYGYVYPVLIEDGKLVN